MEEKIEARQSLVFKIMAFVISVVFMQIIFVIAQLATGKLGWLWTFMPLIACAGMALVSLLIALIFGAFTEKEVK